MNISLRDFLDFVMLWLKKRTGVHLGELVIHRAMVRHCFCCHGNKAYVHETDGLCETCCREQKCTMCKETFTPSMESVGVFCATCWAQLETTWTALFENGDPVRAESKVRSLVTASHPALMGCRHT